MENFTTFGEMIDLGVMAFVAIVFFVGLLIFSTRKQQSTN
jgi:hypothetical protein